ncbi:MAG: hypothetical protein JWL80_281, partial [Parcubacteria group bacterium]|nr:hypothetical protein [Parcubacteria group bacterium]
IAGSFLTNTGTPNEGIVYFDRALKLSPGKQTIYFEKGSALIAEKDYQGALAVFKQAYELEPKYVEARIMYISAAVYADKPDLANSLIQTLTPEQVIGDDRIVNALFAMGKYQDVINLLTSRTELTPENPQVYISLAATYLKIGDMGNAVRVLRLLGEKVPASKAQADEYIKQIQNGTIKVGM